jgi:CRP-like cAMP-binding protein
MAKDMDRVDFVKGDTLLEQGAPQTKAFFIADGSIKRERVVNDQSHQVINPPPYTLHPTP